MALIDLSADMPSNNTVAQAPAVEDAFTQIQAAINGGLDSTNFAAGKIFDPLKIEQDSATNGQGLVWSSAANSGAGGWVPGNITGPGTQISYTSATSTATISSTSEASPTDVISAGSTAYDGTQVILEFWAPEWDAGANGQLVLNLWDASTNLGQVFNPGAVGGSGGSGAPLYVRRIFSPSVASHTYKIRGWMTAGSAGGVLCGAGSAGSLIEMFIRITKG